MRGTIIAQIIGFLALPLITRIFLPESFGRLQLYQSVLMVLLVISSLRFEIALLKSKNEKEVTDIIQVCLLVNIVIVIILAIVCIYIYFQKLIPGSLSYLLFFLPFGVLFAGILQTLGYLPARFKEFEIGATSKIAQSSGYIFSSLILGMVKPVLSGLIIGDILSRVMAIMVYLFNKKFSTRIRLFPIQSIDKLISIIKNHRQLPFITVPGGLINAAGSVITPIFLYWFFSAEILGQYALVERFLMLPIGMIAVAISQVYSADFSEALRNGDIKPNKLFRAVIGRILKYGIIPCILICIFSPFSFIFIFGKNWALAGDLAQLMAPLALISLIVGSVNMTLLIAGFQKTQLFWEAIRLFSMIFLWLYIYYNKVEPKTAISLHVTVNFLMYLLYICITDFMLRRNDEN